MEEGIFDDATDQISQLPEPILQHILSFLEVKEAIQMSVVSKTWNNAVAMLHSLNYGDGSLFPVAKRNENEEAVFDKIRELLNGVESMIRKRQEQNVGVQKFCLRLSHSYKLLDLTPYIIRLTKELSACNIKELVFKVGTYRGKPCYTLPKAVYTWCSLHKLELGGFKLKLPSRGGIISLSSLRELRLYKTDMDHRVFQLLIMSCPELEFLSVDYCLGLDRLQIFGLLKLKEIRTRNCLQNFDKIQIQAPNLECLNHHGLGTLSLVDVNSCKSLKVLVLYSLTCDNKWVEDLFCNLPLLEVFRLIGCDGLEMVKISSNHLKVLELDSCKNLVKTEVDAPLLSEFHYCGSLSVSLSIEAVAKELVSLDIEQRTDEVLLNNELVEFLQNFNHSKVIRLITGELLKLSLAKDLCPPLYDVKHLTVNSDGVDKSKILDLLDSLLWMAPCLDTLDLNLACDEKTVKFTRESPLIVEGVPCCPSVPFKCWHHTLKKVEFDNFENVEDHWKLRNYFVENAKILESIDGLIQCDRA
ncbi:F-box/LRR-repeat protein 13 [Coffea arabica]|uniref:F-box/LRR-repeat protein 13 n=1 Tax=Coffea arabica TaxID=13443 RepID=A0A6P6XJ04_COFAR|nr:FBD-associated F-box protein At4g13985-like [Coffea arabica]